MARKTILIALAAWLSAAGIAVADGSGGQDPVGQALIPPDVVMSHQDALKLSDAQKKAIIDDVQSAQARFTKAQWQLSAATEKLASILQQNRVDQSKALAQLDAVLDLERQIKRTQFTLMIQVKNELTAEQQATAQHLMGNFFYRWTGDNPNQPK